VTLIDYRVSFVVQQEVRIDNLYGLLDNFYRLPGNLLRLPGNLYRLSGRARRSVERENNLSTFIEVDNLHRQPL